MDLELYLFIDCDVNIRTSIRQIECGSEFGMEGMSYYRCRESRVKTEGVKGAFLCFLVCSRFDSISLHFSHVLHTTVRRSVCRSVLRKQIIFRLIPVEESK